MLDVHCWPTHRDFVEVFMPLGCIHKMEIALHLLYATLSRVSGDGNCLYNAVYVAVNGDGSKWGWQSMGMKVCQPH